MSKTSDLITDTPIFIETLAARAHCELPDAAEHFEQLGPEHPVEAFIEEYGTSDE